MVYLSTELDVTEHDYKHCLKYPYLASQIFNDYRVEKVMEAFLSLTQPNEGQRLAKMYAVFRTSLLSPQLNPTLTGYFDGVFRTLLGQHPAAVLKVALAEPQLALVFEHFDDFSVLGVLLKTVALEAQTATDMGTETYLPQRLTVMDRVLDLFLKTKADFSITVYSSDLNTPLGLTPAVEKILNGAAFFRYLIKDMISLDPGVVARIKDAVYFGKILEPFFSGKDLKAWESLSILFTLLDEVSNRRRKQVSIIEEGEVAANDDFVESAPFLQLYSRVVSRCGELLLEKQSPSLEIQILAVLSQLASFSHMEVANPFLSADILNRTVETVNRGGNNNIAHSKAVELFERVFGAKPLEPLAIQAFGKLISVLASKLPAQSPSK